MKRDPALRQLSDDHHRALVLSRRLRQTPETITPSDLAFLAREVEREFDAELEPHFRVEERWLFPALADAGAAALVSEALEDHARLRALVRSDWADATARRLGLLLEKHVRFEERVLFPEAERSLNAEQLAAVRHAAERSANPDD